MPSDYLSNDEALSLLKLPKIEIERYSGHYLLQGQQTIELISIDTKFQFLFDVNCYQIRLTYQTRTRSKDILARLDLGGILRHRNPNGEIITGPHIHLYKEGFNDRFAYPLDPQFFSDPSDFLLSIEEFMRFCNIQGIGFREV
ncbi:MAG: hypothetical protein QM523_04845 [Candidatus Pacebacteria bacterium]|nr:hypothetical protein [Candidatus Paceibacterota bacterium]